jgi:hypothetical protein
MLGKVQNESVQQSMCLIAVLVIMQISNTQRTDDGLGHKKTSTNRLVSKERLWFSSGYHLANLDRAKDSPWSMTNQN